MNEELISFYLASYNSSEKLSFSVHIKEIKTEMGEFFLGKLKCSIDALTNAQRADLKNVSKLKALFHHYMIHEVHAKRLLSDNSETEEMASDWFNPSELDEVYSFKGHMFHVGFVQSRRVPDWFSISITSNENRDLSESRSLGKMPSCISTNEVDDQHLVSEIIDTFVKYFKTFVIAVAENKTRKRRAAGDASSSSSSSLTRIEPVTQS